MMESEEAGATRAVAPVIRDVIDPTRIEPQVLVDVELDPRPTAPVPVRIARLDLPPGGSFRPTVEPCQDVLILVREGELRVVGSGIAPPSAPGTIYGGDAVRFGPEGDGLLQNLSDRQARTVVAFVRAERGAECVEPGGDDPLVEPIRMTSVSTVPALSTLGGALRVRILLDADGAGARHGGLSVLDGAPDLVMPQHRHAGAAEILYIEQGEGVLRIGERAVRVRPGVALYVAPGELHSYEGHGSPLHAIQVFTPAGPEQAYRRSDG